MENPGKQTEIPPSKVEVEAKSTCEGPQVPMVESNPAGLRSEVIPSQSLGLQVLFNPPEDDIELDIIAVHGIGVNPLETWIHPVTKVNWLSDETMLPSVFPSARIMGFGYHSVWFGENASKQTLDGVATSLLNCLEQNRENCPNRPIIFIGHCFGGLVMQQVYLLATGNPDHPGVANSISGLIFLGTPHNGVSERGGLSTQSEIYEAIAKTGVQIQNNIMHTMAQDTDLLVNTVSHFTRRVNTANPPPKLFCFYERMATNAGLIIRKKVTKEFIVNETSGTLPGHQKEGLALDHFSMNKFENAYDGNYKAVQYQIKKMVKEIKGRVNEPEQSDPKMRPRRRNHIPNSSAPIAREANFAPRDGVLQTIEIGFRKTARVALYGGSGVGKTHIAVEYAHFFHDIYPEAKVFWVNANSVEQFELSYRRIDEKLRLNLGRDSGQNVGVVERVYQYLRQDSAGYWLMILDGLENQDDLMSKNAIYQGKSLLEFLPNSFSARVLITTRNKPLAAQMVSENSKYMIKVSPLNSEDASYLLLGRVTRDQGKKKWVKEMSKRLGSSAGAMVLVPAYIENAGKDCDRERYLKKIEEHDAEHKSSESKVPSVWALLHQLLAKKHPHISELMLRICSLEVQSIPAEFFERSEVWEEIPILTKYGLVEPSTDGLWFTVTALFRSWGQIWLKEHRGDRVASEEAVLSLMVKKFTPATSEPLLPCALAVLKFKPTSTQAKRQMSNLLFSVAQYYYARTSQYAIAVKLLEKSLPLRENEIDSGDKLGWIKKAKAAMKEAMELESKSTTKSRVDGSGTKLEKANEQLKTLETIDAAWEDRNTARQASNLAAMKLTQSGKGGTNGAVALYQRLLKWSNSEDDSNHLKKAHYEYNLALAYDAEGEYQEAEKLYSSALSILSSRKRSEAPDHHLGALYLKIMSSMAGMHCRRGQLEKAEDAFRVVYPAQRDLLGIDHPETLITRHNMSLLVQNRGQLDPAADEMRSVLNMQMQLLEPNDPATFRTACGLALNYRLRKKHQESKKMYEAILESQRVVLGEDHCDTVGTRQMLAELVGEMEK